MTTIQGFDYPAEIQFEEKDDLLVQKNEPGYFGRMDTIRACLIGSLIMLNVGCFTIGLAFSASKIQTTILTEALGTIIVASGLLLSGSVSKKMIINRSIMFIPEDSKFRAEYSEGWERSREKFGKESEINDLINYICLSGAENTEKWGLRLHPDSHPLMTKNKMRNVIMSEKSIPMLFQLFETSMTRFREKIKLIDLVDKYGVLSQEDRKIIEKRLIHFIPIYQEMGQRDSFVDDLITYGFNTTPEMQHAISN